jgi:hypothetical protein
MHGGASEAVSKEGSRSNVALEQLVHSLLSEGGGFQLTKAIAVAEKHVEYSQAAQSLTLRHALPNDVQAVLMKDAANGSAAQQLTEESLAKARQFLNIMVEKAQIELDDKIIEAKEFHSRNRGTQAQVVRDIATLSGYIADLMGQIAEAETCISETTTAITEVKKKRAEEKDAYEKEYNINYADIVIKQNDLDVFDFLIKTTKKICDAQANSFIQTGHPEMELCSSKHGGAFRFSDSKLQQKFDQVLAKGSHDLLSGPLSQMLSRPMTLVQLVASKDAQPAKEKTPVTSGQADDFGDIKCGPIPDCGLLYDTLSLQWGMYKDRVDELKNEMDENEEAWNVLKADLDAQIQSLNDKLDRCTRELSEATAAKNKNQHELEQKQEEKRHLDEEHSKTMKKFRDRITYIVQQDICGPTVVRNEVMKESTVCPPKDIDDCDVTPWTAAACSVECDDRCPDIVGCGGTQTLTRTVVVRPNECGIRCPELSRSRMCSQFKCPVDCVMSRWSGFSKCSKECEGGVQQQSRAVITRHKNGGVACSAVSEARACNTFSCDRDCTLEDWTMWSPCSMACNGGNQDRVRNVEIPIRGDGKCPRSKSRVRLEEQTCNTHSCVGDEICIAKQDLVIAVDGSGSIHAEGFKLVRNFTGEMLKRYKVEYHAETTMQIALVIFGNGIIEDDGSISKAVLLRELSTDLAATKEAAAGMEHQKGFTNMAQAFVLARKLLTQKGRAEAQSAVMTISDGKPSFLFETREQAKTLESKGIMRFMVGISEFPGSDAWQLMQELASQPAFTNSVRVPGIDALQDGAGAFVEEALVKFCPASMSPSLNLKEERAQGYILVRKAGYCGWLGRLLGRKVFGADRCAELARKSGATAFSMGQKWRRGRCNVEIFEFTCEVYKQWQDNPENPSCSWSGSGSFHSSSGYDWYAIQPDCPTSLLNSF